MKFKNKLETGRSMVEIIGVLAVVGVLSVGGIMGYSYGMDRHKANETVKGLTLRALDIQSQVDKCSGEICDVSIDGWEDDTPYTITMEDDGLLHINGVSSRVCKIIGDLLMDSAAVYVEGIKYNPNSTTDPCDTRDDHALFFDFDPVVLADMDDVGQQPDTEEIKTEILYASHPGNEEEEETTLATHSSNLEDTATYATETGATNIDCYHNGYLFEIQQQGLNCGTVCPNRKTYYGGCVLKCENGFLDVFSGTCHSCDTPEDVIEVDPSECAKCPNRESYPTAANDGCRLKGVYTSGGYEETSISGDIENTEFIVCPSVEADATYCNYEAPIWVDPNDVCTYLITSQCLNREMQGDYSVKLCDMEEYYANGGSCVPLSVFETSTIYATEEITTEETTLFPVKPDTETTLFPVEEYTGATTEISTELVTTAFSFDYASKVAELTAQNPGCPAAYYDSSSSMIYYYDADDAWDPCWKKSCSWESSINQWMCQY